MLQEVSVSRRPALQVAPPLEGETPLVGVYVAQAFIANSPNAAPTESNVMYIRRQAIRLVTLECIQASHSRI